MNHNDKVYTREADGTIQRWYVYAWQGPYFSVSTVRNAKLKDYKRYFHMNDIGRTVFLNRKDVK